MHDMWRLYILVDSGSTHNFLSEQTAHKLGYPIQKAKGVHATVANGQELHCKGWCKELKFRV